MPVLGNKNKVMSMVRLEISDLEFILKKITLTPNLREVVKEAQRNDGFLPDEVADELRDLCGEQFRSHGFDDSDRLTEEGKKLEALIDKLFVDAA